MMNKIVITGGEFTPAPCAYCGNVKELRPYGRAGANICFDCAMKPENKSFTDQAFINVLDGKSEHPSSEQSN